MTGVETDGVMHCERREMRIDRVENAQAEWRPSRSWCDRKYTASGAFAVVAQVVFTIEAILRILAEGWSPMRYFSDRDEGGWNSMDFSSKLRLYSTSDVDQT